MSAKVRQFMKRLFSSTDGLTRQLTVAEAEAEFAVRIKELRQTVPFGFLNPEWVQLKAKMHSGDQLWEFKLRGTGITVRGVKLVRRAKLIDFIGAELSQKKPPPPYRPRRNDPWNLIESGQYELAVRAFTARLRRDKSSRNYEARGFAYLNIGDYDSALADFRAADAVHVTTSDAYLQDAGVAQWLAGRELEAASTWRDLVLAHEQGKIQYSDFAGGVESPCLLWFAAVRLGQDQLLKPARRLLKEKTGRKNAWRIKSWPGPIAKYLLDRITEDQLRSKVEPEIPILHERQLCEAEFYIGVRRLQAGDQAGAKKAFRAAARLTPAKIENEYYLALHESKRPLRKVGARKRRG
jgi:tetratricopeptide (TPR) repeat protein